MISFYSSSIFVNFCFFRSAFGNGNATTNPPVFDVGGGGGGGSSYGGGCDIGTYINIAGTCNYKRFYQTSLYFLDFLIYISFFSDYFCYFLGLTGNGFNGTLSGGVSRRGFLSGVGAGGKPGGVKGGDGLVIITFVPNFALLRKYLLTSLSTMMTP